MPDTIAVHRLAQRYQLPRQLAQFMSLLVTEELVTPKLVLHRIGQADARTLAFRLRQALTEAGVEPPIIICMLRTIGYWLDPEVRLSIAALIGLDLNCPCGRPVQECSHAPVNKTPIIVPCVPVQQVSESARRVGRRVPGDKPDRS